MAAVTLFVFPDIGVVEILAWFIATACVLWVDRFRAEKSFNGCESAALFNVLHDIFEEGLTDQVETQLLCD